MAVKPLTCGDNDHFGRWKMTLSELSDNFSEYLEKYASQDRIEYII